MPVILMVSLLAGNVSTINSDSVLDVRQTVNSSSSCSIATALATAGNAGVLQSSTQVPAPNGIDAHSINSVASSVSSNNASGMYNPST